MDIENQTFEDAMKALEIITNKIQDKNISLEDSLKYYEQGKKLVQFCQKKLIQVEQKIQILNQADELEEFDINGS